MTAETNVGDGPWFIDDQAITDKSEDAFAHDDIAEQLAAIVGSVTPPATVGLVGGFGTGKSSITNLLSKRLKAHDRYQLVTLSAEKHTGVARQRALVYSFAQALHEDAGVDRKKISSLLERVEHEEIREGPDLFVLPFPRWTLRISGQTGVSCSCWRSRPRVSQRRCTPSRSGPSG